ncbi:MAG: glycogen debranching enzyme family protein [Verrucomicrobia bacterium]|nr:glycogen debranching enzyme family protein [Verrucomicrobiota bacterium]
MSSVSDSTEWLEADGLGGFASGTSSGIRTRRYHALLLTATTPPSERKTLVNGLEAWVETARGTWFLTSQRYAPEVVYPDGVTRIKNFELRPWPAWRFELDETLGIEQELFVPYGRSAVVLIWRLAGDPGNRAKLIVRPFLSGRDFHGTHHENDSFIFEPKLSGDQVRWKPYNGIPAVVAQSTGSYRHSPTWYRNFCYVEERARGLDYVEDLASPGLFDWDLLAGAATLIFFAEGFSDIGNEDGGTVGIANKIRAQELERRKVFSNRLSAASDSYLVQRGSGKTIIAGYPWFGDWGRDTFISLRGLCLATDRLAAARDILLEWASTVSMGMLPNRFPDRGVQPEFNSVDASLWYIIAVSEYLNATRARPDLEDRAVTEKLHTAIDAILSGYSGGTRFRIKVDEDGLLAAGEPGVQLTWMDAKVDGQVITPRIGKPVEVQALWINALWVGQSFSSQWKPFFTKAAETFAIRFWNQMRNQLFDVLDVDHQPGAVDASCRPNQILSVGGLPLVLLSMGRARQVVKTVEAALYTPMGLRSLAPEEPGYVPRYEGDAWHRDSAYHQGTVWPWLIGPFIEAWVRVRGNTREAKELARKQFLEPLLYHLDQAGLGHVSEIADAAPPHTPRGCPFQAWSLGELLRLDQVVLR